MQVGVLVPTLFPFESSRAALRLAEEMAADSVWFPDHLLGLFHPELFADSPASQFLSDPDAWLDPWTVAALCSTQTRLPLGLCVTDATRRRAADVARTALTLHHACAGGFRVGVGSGEAESLLPFGYPYDRPVAVCEEFLRELRSLFDTGRMPDGGVGRLGLPLETRAGRPQIWVAGHGPRMLRLTGQYGDGWMPAWRMQPSEYAEKRDTIARHAAAAGRAAPVCGMLLPTVVGHSRERLEELFEAQPLAKLGVVFADAATWARHGLEHPAGPDSRGLIDLIVHSFDAAKLREIAPRIPMALVEDYYYLGSAEEIAAQIEPFVRAGARCLVIGNMSGMAGGLAEAEARVPEVAKLRRLLGEL